MAYEVPLGLNGQLPAHVDLSGSQFLAVWLNGLLGVDVCVTATGAGSYCLGILQNNPKAGRACTIEHAGISKAVSGAALATPGVPLMVNGSGQLVLATGTNTVVGYLLDTATAAGQVITVQLV